MENTVKYFVGKGLNGCLYRLQDDEVTFYHPNDDSWLPSLVRRSDLSRGSYWQKVSETQALIYIATGVWCDGES